MSSTAERLPRAAEAAAPHPKSQVFIYEDGFLFSSEGLASARTERFTGTLLLATSDADFDIDVGGQRKRLGIALMKPFLSKVLHTEGVPFASLGVGPSHPAYRAFSRIGGPGYAALPRGRFPGLRTPLRALRGGMGLGESRRVFDLCIEAIVAELPQLEPMDARVERVMALLAKDHSLPLDALADAACLSYFRLSHLFSEQMGLTLRQYLLSLKIHAACRFMGMGMNLTDTAHAAGFTDSAHLSRVWAKAFGASPSHFLDTRAFAIQPPRSPALAPSH